VDSKIHELAKEGLDRIDIAMIAQAVRDNDSLAFRVLDEAVSYLEGGGALCLPQPFQNTA